MSYGSEMLTLKFKKQKRTYANVPIETAYKLVYSKTPVKTFNEFIKKKFKVIEVVCL